jgi:hypothetical protein
VLLASGALVVDALPTRRARGAAWIALSRRPVLFALARALARRGPAASTATR